MDKLELVEIVKSNPVNRAILDRLPSTALNDAWLVSGCLFQTVWNWRTGRDPQFGIKDYDIFYFDNEDLSWEAEDTSIRQASQALCGINATIEVRNQARVHLWYTEKFGIPYERLSCATEGIDRFLAVACMVGIQPDNNGKMNVYSPKGLEDLDRLIIRPNDLKTFDTKTYRSKSKRWLQSWPELRIVDVE